LKTSSTRAGDGEMRVAYWSATNHVGFRRNRKKVVRNRKSIYDENANKNHTKPQTKMS